MYVICTDGEIVVRSKIVSDDAELAELNQQASEATGSNWWWEPGNKENAEYPKAEEYRHIPLEMFTIDYCQSCGGAGMGCPFCDGGLVEVEQQMKSYAVWYDNGTGWFEGDKIYYAYTAAGALRLAGGAVTKFGTAQVVTASWKDDPNRGATILAGSV